MPRLSVDIDLNYVCAESMEEMRNERPLIEEALQAVFSREDYTVRRMPEEHRRRKVVVALHYRFRCECRD